MLTAVLSVIVKTGNLSQLVMVKPTTGQSHHRMLPSKKKEQIIDTCTLNLQKMMPSEKSQS